MRFCLLATTLFAFWANCAAGQPPAPTEECLKANKQCEENTDCIHRLAVLQSACVTNTCQPQCRESALNLYQNREGRQLLRTDASCIPGRYELEKCGLLPLRAPKHCQLAKLICETDLQCNAKWEVFISECEAETSQGRCSPQCRLHLNNTLATYHGAGLQGCTCTDKDDSRCVQLRDFTLRTCLQPDSPLPTPPPVTDNNIPDFIKTNQIEQHPASADPGDIPEPDSAAQHFASFIVCVSSMFLWFIARL
ncbi:GDNF/GAS1 domain-containing protein [Aphelenchoides besseyi]|nr:GDNF/GAS1 domain-containing protein [Aphelenchoides besseyi]